MTGFDPSCIEVDDYLDCLDIRNVEKATEHEYRFSCPMPAHATGDDSPSAYMNANTTAVFCHSCHFKGNAVTLAAEILGVSPIQATRMLKQRYQPGGIDPDSRNMEEEIKKLIGARAKPDRRQNKVIDEKCLDSFEVNWQVMEEMRDLGHNGSVPEWAHYMFDRGFTAQVLIEWQFGYHQEKNRITLPIRDENGNLVGIKARAPDKITKPKYLNLRDADRDIEPFLKNEIVFALDKASKTSSGMLIVVEGEWNAIAMHSMGFTSTVAINGSYFGERQIKLIVRNADYAFLFFDTDKAGVDATQAVGNALRPFIDVLVCPDHFGDPMQMHLYSVRKCLQEARSWTDLMLSAV